MPALSVDSLAISFPTHHTYLYTVLYGGGRMAEKAITTLPWYRVLPVARSVSAPYGSARCLIRSAIITMPHPLRVSHAIDDCT